MPRLYSALHGASRAGINGTLLGVGAIEAEGRMVHPERFERPTYWFVASCSIQLSYGCTWLQEQLFEDKGLRGSGQPVRAETHRFAGTVSVLCQCADMIHEKGIDLSILLDQFQAELLFKSSR
jgi:hypothetical protein